MNFRSNPVRPITPQDTNIVNAGKRAPMKRILSTAIPLENCLYEPRYLINFRDLAETHFKFSSDKLLRNPTLLVPANCSVMSAICPIFAEIRYHSRTGTPCMLEMVRFLAIAKKYYLSQCSRTGGEMIKYQVSDGNPPSIGLLSYSKNLFNVLNFSRQDVDNRSSRNDGGCPSRTQHGVLCQQ